MTKMPSSADALPADERAFALTRSDSPAQNAVYKSAMATTPPACDTGASDKASATDSGISAAARTSRYRKHGRYENQRDDSMTCKLSAQNLDRANSLSKDRPQLASFSFARHCRRRERGSLAAPGFGARMLGPEERSAAATRTRRRR